MLKKKSCSLVHMFLWIVSIYLWHYMVSHHRRRWSLKENIFLCPRV